MLATFDIGTMMSQENQIKEIPLDMLNHTYNHQFTMYDDEKRSDMTESIRKHGVMQPVIVRPDPREFGKYEILAGNNRCRCSRDAGKETIPAIIKENLSEEEAKVYIAFTNLLQRGFGDIRISEQAAVIAAYHSELFTSEKRNAIADELTAMENGVSGKSKLAAAGEEYGLSKDSVARLIRINKLIPQLKPWVDSKQLAVRAAVELSYIPENGQELIFNICKDTSNDKKMFMKIDTKRATLLRKAFQDNPEISRNEVIRLFSDKPKKKTVKIKSELYSKYFDEDSDETEIIAVIEKALEYFFDENT
ncbi:MAG: ParB/RepB/Spo0J family partition protein [Oscillospiraceae bacterium]|jgi:ParB family chromosome partitioning protein